VRLLQRFDTFTLATDAQPPSSLPPAEWKLGRGRQRVETIYPDAAMTLFIKVRYLIFALSCIILSLIGWLMDQNEEFTLTLM
jgi:hypothetical protein